jgi:hypothetical protein
MSAKGRDKNKPPQKKEPKSGLAEKSSAKAPLKVAITEDPPDRWCKPSNIIPSVAVFVALIAVFVSAWTHWENRKHNVLSVKPIINLEKSSAFDARQGIYMVNAGLGPAIIKSIALLHIDDIKSIEAIYGDMENNKSPYVIGNWHFAKDYQKMARFHGKLLMNIPSLKKGAKDQNQNMNWW